MSNETPDLQYDEARLDPLELRLDPQNPRLRRDERGAGRERLLEVMVERFKLEELAESIVTSGFIEFDPIIAFREDDTSVTVLEGNRRLAVLKLLLNPQLAPTAKQRVWQRLSNRVRPEQRNRIETLKVLLFPDRKAGAVRAYIGFRHVTGVLQWSPLEKANYIADLLDNENWTYSEIANRLGSYPKHVERHYVAHQIVLQAADEEIEGAESMRDAFGVLMRALQAPGVREYLGVNYPGQPAASETPVPPTNVTKLRFFVKWTFGTKSTLPVLRDSRHLTKWGKILASSEAESYLRRAPVPDFDRAWLKSGGQAESVSDSLYTAADRLEESVPLVSEHADDDDVASAVRECARFLQQILSYFPKVAKQHGFTGSNADV